MSVLIPGAGLVENTSTLLIPKSGLVESGVVDTRLTVEAGVLQPSGRPITLGQGFFGVVLHSKNIS